MENNILYISLISIKTVIKLINSVLNTLIDPSLKRVKGKAESRNLEKRIRI